MFSNQWEQDDALGYSPSALAQGAAAATCDGSADVRAQWAQVLTGAILFTAMAVKARDWAKVQQGEDLMAMASGRAGLDSAFLSAVFGGDVPAVDMSNRLIAACYDAGGKATAQALDSAREVVRANKALREAADRARKAAGQANRAALSAQVRAEQKSERTDTAAQSGLTVGAVVQVTWTYKQARRDVATTAGGDIVECYGRLPGCGEGSGQARVKKVGGCLPVVELI